VPLGSVIHGIADSDLAFVLFVLGVGGVFVEVLHPGPSVAGLVGLLGLVGSFVLFSDLPVFYGGVILLVAAYGFFLLHLKMGGHLFPTIAAAVCFVAGGLLLYDPSSNDEVSRPLLAVIAVLFTVLMVVLVRAAIHARELPVVSGVEQVVGSEGTVTHRLAPDGQVRVRGEVWSASSDDGRPLAKGAAVRVVAVRGLRLVVRDARPAAADVPGRSDPPDDQEHRA
jgi:membrane-bound serine protease (ClpP class)